MNTLIYKYVKFSKENPDQMVQKCYVVICSSYVVYM